MFDLSALNRHLVIPRFRMESPITIMGSLRRGNWLVSIDVKDAYLHVPIHPQYRRYLHLAFQGKVYRFRVLPFGIATAPYVFTRLVAAMAARFHREGIRFYHYLDDWLIVGDSPQEVHRSAIRVLQMSTGLGWIPNWDKSMLTPSQHLVHVGIEFDLERGLALPPVDRLQKLESMARPLLAGRQGTARQLLSLIGILASIEKQVPFGRCFLRPIQWGLALQWRIASDHLDEVVLVDPDMTEAIHWWLNPGNTRVGVSLEPFEPDLFLFTDASQEAWGAHLDDWQLSHLWSEEETGLHINQLELRAVRYAYQEWSPHFPRGNRWLVFTDNSTVVAHLNKQGGTRARHLSLEAEELLRLVRRNGHQLRARHIPGKRNVWADQLSRPSRVLSTEWSLCPRVFDHIAEVFFRPQIDLFATSVNTKVPVFYSPLPESTALGTDAISHSWDGMWAYAYPPTGFIREVLKKLQRSRCEMILVAPAWPGQPWFPLLLSLLVDEPRALPVREKLLRQPRTSFYHLNPGMLRLHAWRLSSDPTARRAFLERCPITSLEGTEPLPRWCIKPSGEYTPVGVVEDRLIRALPL